MIKNIVDELERIAKKTPHHIAVEFSGKKLSYKELNEQANQLAHYLLKKGIQSQDFVGIYLEKSTDLVIGILAIQKIGAAYVPIDAAYPKHRKLYMIKDANIRFLITSSVFEKEWTHLELIVVDRLKLSESVKNLEMPIQPLWISHVIYTSGTTGNPKGVLITHKGVVHLAKAFGFSAKDRFLQISNISFDAYTQELWGALLNGATVCIYPQLTYVPHDLGKFIEHEKITVILFTSRIFTLMVEEALEAFKHVRFIGVGGDVMSAKQAKIFIQRFPKCQLYNEYGPAENTVCSTAYRVLDVADVVPIGRPLAHTTAYVLDEKQEMKTTGELYVGGEALAQGYLNLTKLNQEKFIKNPFGSGFLYRTGDLVRLSSDGNLEFLGRIDNQVKIRGFRIELEEIEEAMRSRPNVTDCVCIVKEIQDDKQLIAYIESKKKLKKEALSTWAKSHLPTYMIPHFFILLKKFPMTANGKVDKNALPPVKIEAKKEKFSSKTEKTISTLWSELLNIPIVRKEDHFFEIGGDSIHAMRLHAKMSENFPFEIPIRLIFEVPVLKAYAKKIDELKIGIHHKKAKKSLKKEAVLDPLIRAKGKIKPGVAKNIFLTGATGLVGSFFVRELIENTKAHIFCLVRGETQEEATQHLIQTSQKYLIWKPTFEKRITVISGSLDLPLFGLSKKQFSSLGKEIDSIFHIGAFVNHVMSYEQHKRANVLGTQEVLRLACQNRVKPVQFISTLASLEGIKDPVISEDANLDRSQHLSNGYIESKWVAEKLILIARKRGIPCNIFRLPRVAGDTRTGSGPTADFLWRLVHASIKLRKIPKTNLYDDLTPVDYICKAILLISRKEINSQFHVMSPNPTHYSAIFEWIKNLGYPLQWIDFASWKKALMNEAKRSDDRALQALSSLVTETESKPMNEMNFSSANFQAACSLKCPKMTASLVKKYMKYYKQIGFA